MRAKLVEIKGALNRMRHLPVPKQGRWLGQVMRGYLAHHVVPTNARKIASFHHFVEWHLRGALSRRSQKAAVALGADGPVRRALVATRLETAT